MTWLNKNTRRIKHSRGLAALMEMPSNDTDRLLRAHVIWKKRGRNTRLLQEKIKKWHAKTLARADTYRNTGSTYIRRNIDSFFLFFSFFRNPFFEELKFSVFGRSAKYLPEKEMPEASTRSKRVLRVGIYFETGLLTGYNLR